MQKKYIYCTIALLFSTVMVWILWKNIDSEDTVSVASVSDKSGKGVPSIGGPFTLTDHKGQIRKNTDFHGKYMMVYFGYRSCPDICPTALNTMTETLNKLGAKSNHIQPLFISVDPQRDTQENLAEYVENFHPHLIALTGNKEQIKNVKRAYRVFSQRVEEDNKPHDDPHYLVDHSSIIYVMDRQGHMVAHFNHTTEPDHIVKSLRQIL